MEVGPQAETRPSATPRPGCSPQACCAWTAARRVWAGNHNWSSCRRPLSWPAWWLSWVRPWGSLGRMATSCTGGPLTQCFWVARPCANPLVISLRMGPWCGDPWCQKALHAIRVGFVVVVSGALAWSQRVLAAPSCRRAGGATSGGASEHSSHHPGSPKVCGVAVAPNRGESNRGVRPACRPAMRRFG